jgi:hypothetical protein
MGRREKDPSSQLEEGTGVGGRGTINKDLDWNWARNNKKLFTFHLFNSGTTLAPTLDKYQVFNHKLRTGQGTRTTGTMLLVRSTPLTTPITASKKMPGALI